MKRKCGSQMFWVLPISAMVLLVGDPPWKNKSISNWTEDDARAGPHRFPWAKKVRAGITPRRTEDQLRKAGQMGQLHGIGVDGVRGKEVGAKLSTALGGPHPKVGGLVKV